MVKLPGIQEELAAISSSKAKFVILSALPRQHINLAADLLGKQLDSQLTVYVFRSEEQFDSWIQSKSSSSSSYREFGIGTKFDPVTLTELGYTKVGRVYNPGEFSLYGDVVNIWHEGWDHPVRISLLGAEIEEIDIVDAESRRGLQKIKKFALLPVRAAGSDELPEKTIGNEASPDLYPIQFVTILNSSNIALSDKGYPVLNLGWKLLPDLEYTQSNFSALSQLFAELAAKRYQIYYAGDSLEKLRSADKQLLKYIDTTKLIDFGRNDLRRGFINNRGEEIYLTDYELFGELDLTDILASSKDIFLSPSKRGEHIRQSDKIFKKIKPGEFVVHEDHGISIFTGVIEKSGEHFLKLEYAGKDRLYVPLSQARKVSKYIGSKTPALTTLNSGGWRLIKRHVNEDAEKLAKELVQLYAMRQISNSAFLLDLNRSRKEIDRFIAGFRYSDTEDQAVATEEILNDMCVGHPMDRLLVGDVGFGKTEVAMRAAFAAVKSGFQVAILAPTTILVEQHGAVVQDRFRDEGVRYATLSRFMSRAENRKVVDRLAAGEIDIIVGTHSLLSDSVKFKNLGLIIIDEEQRFGVKQKEKLRQARVQAHVLSMSATPIPRSLNMSLSGVKDISIIATPPVGRKPIKNEFAKFSWEAVTRAISKEIERSGQVYLVHNRVKNLAEYARKVEQYFPDSVVDVVHGQMSSESLSRSINSFVRGETKILVCTTIIENGIDIPNVNTLIVTEAERYGLSQLYQIRGRVGRSDKQAYAHFLYSTLAGEAGERLDALAEAKDLGAGFTVASRDLEIRGAGTLLGREQSGSIGAVGYGMYIQVLNEKIDEMKRKVDAVKHK